MEALLIPLLLITVGYLTGSIASAIVVARLSGIADPRQHGSGNPGATNVLRLGGKRLAAVTLVGDLIKGLLPVLLARLLGAEPVVLALVGLAAFLGHIYPVWFGFRGGKGVATALGVLLGLHWPTALVALLTWIAMAALFRISSLAAVTAAAVTPVALFLLKADTATSIAGAAMAILLLLRHRSNIQRLIRGEEGRFGRG